MRNLKSRKRKWTIGNKDDGGLRQSYQDWVALWSLRMLVNLGGSQRLIDRRGDIIDDDVLVAIRMEHLEDMQAATKEKRALLKKELRKVEGQEISAPETALRKNIDWLGEALNLNRVECEILHFSVLLHNISILDDVADTLGDIDGGRLIRIYSTVLELPFQKVTKALKRNSTLVSSGLLSIDSSNNHGLKHKIDLLSGMSDALLHPYSKPDALFESYLKRSRKASLKRSDYPHIEQDYELLLAYLKGVTRNRTSGVNVLVYGAPGTGKTELVRTLSRELGLKLYEISFEDEDGDPHRGNDRFSAFRLSQRLLSRKKKTAILFDEIEDVFPSGGFSFMGMSFRGDGEQGKKAWINQQLESNPVPSFWLSNEISQIDPAFLRRYDYVLEVPAPTRTVRQSIMRKYLGDLEVSESWLKRMSQFEVIQPAHIERAAKVVRHLPQEGVVREKVLERVLGNTLEALGEPRKPKTSAGVVPSYRLNFLNPDQDLGKVVAGLKQRPAGRFCLYGAPGTGKSEFGKYIAEELDQPLLVRRASELLGSFVGETEKAIAGMFREAEREGSILMIDEADSFLRDRSGASQSWEVTQVNELLTQLEAFEGIFIASTNLMDDLDAASLRRFDLKIRFDYLRSEQSWSFFNEVVQSGGEMVSKDIQQRLAAIDNLAPGDFATVLRRSRITGVELDAEYLLDELVRECEIKRGGASRPIGFVH